jgi:hypothetical protein
MNQLKIPLKIRLINWWLIALALLEIFFGLGIFWIPANWNGDYIPAGLKWDWKRTLEIPDNLGD